MTGIMQYAFSESKRLLRFETGYACRIMDMCERLKVARERAGYETAKEAAASLGVPISTYTGHENGSRGYTKNAAQRYGRKFKVAPEWLLFGTGPAPAWGEHIEDPDAELEQDVVVELRSLRPEQRRFIRDMVKRLASGEA